MAIDRASQHVFFVGVCFEAFTPGAFAYNSGLSSCVRANAWTQGLRICRAMQVWNIEMQTAPLLQPETPTHMHVAVKLLLVYVVGLTSPESES